MKLIIPVLATFLLLLSSCGVHIQKRLYRDGFYISTNNNRADRPANHTELLRAFETTGESPSDDTINVADDSVATTEDERDSTGEKAVEVNSETPVLHDLHLTKPAVVRVQPDPPSEKTVEEEIETIRKLKLATQLTLIGWLIFIFAVVAVPAALVLAIITLHKIRKLKRHHTLTEEQRQKVEKIRSHQIAVMGLAIGILVLAALLLFAFALYAGAMGVPLFPL